ncbi:MAG: DUF2934 domain-containing protein [Candidatus Sulfotelmatobacter sp.]
MDIETRRQKQQALIVKLVERKVRSRAKQLYETRGEVEGHALQDWVQAESEVTKKNTLAPLYRRSRPENQDAPKVESRSDLGAQNSSACETSA